MHIIDYSKNTEVGDELVRLFNGLEDLIKNNNLSRSNLFLQKIERGAYLINKETETLQRRLIFLIGIRKEIAARKWAAFLFLCYVNEYFLLHFFLRAPKGTICRMFGIFGEVHMREICCRIARENIWGSLFAKKVFSRIEIILINQALENSRR